MTRRIFSTIELLPIATAGLLALTWPLPLRWWTVAATAGALAILTVASVRRALRGPDRPRTSALAAAFALATVGSIALGYAAFALVHVGAFGPAGRLGYPFLLATRLRLEGGAWLLALCGLVSVTPAMFRREGISERS